MAIIPQMSFFSWEDVEVLDDLSRLTLVIETIPDENLMRLLEKERSRGRPARDGMISLSEYCGISCWSDMCFNMKR